MKLNKDQIKINPNNPRFIKDDNFKKPGDTVLDSFGDSGTTLIAAEQLGRNACVVELDPKYVDVIRKRYAKFISPDDSIPENWEELTPELSEN